MSATANRASRRRPGLLWGIAVATLLVLAVPGCAIGVALVNNANAATIGHRIQGLVDPADARVLDTFGEVGRWAPAGNGTEYFAGVIVESDLSRTDLAERMRELGERVRPELRLSVTGVSDAELAGSRTGGTLQPRISRLGAAPNRFVIATVESPQENLLYSGDLRGH